MNEKARPFSETSSAKSPRGCLVLFFSIFLLAGCGIVWTATGRPTLAVLAARDWVERSALVLGSEIREHSGDGTTYSPAIRYSYRVDGVLYESNRYDFYGGSTSRLNQVREAVGRYSAGAEVPCFVNPANPREAVLIRDFDSRGWFGLFGLLFAAAGAGGISFALRAGKRAPQAESPRGPLTLQPSTSPARSVWTMSVFTLLWNGFIGFFAWVAYIQDDPLPFLAKAMIAIFGGLGLLMIWGAVSGFRKLFLPFPRLTLPGGVVRLAASARVEWRFEGRTGILRSLSIVLEGREEAQFKQGTDILTEKSVFFRKEILSTADPLRLASGGEVFAIPPHLVPSLAADSNKIVWLFRIVAATDGSEQVEAEFAFPVTSETGEADDRYRTDQRASEVPAR